MAILMPFEEHDSNFWFILFCKSGEIKIFEIPQWPFELLAYQLYQVDQSDEVDWTTLASSSKEHCEMSFFSPDLPARVD